VKSLSRSSSDKWTLATEAGNTAEYDHVILAAPYHFSNINISMPALSPNALGPLVPPQPYVHLHVTLLTTKSPHARPRYFNLPEDKTTGIPTMMLTTHDAVRTRGTPEPEFNSLSYHGRVRNADGTPTSSGEWVVKIFSKERVKDEWLTDVFGHVGWVYRQEWDAYPVLPPTTTFPQIKLDKDLYYVNAFEP
jgi:prenylcysteine oxidase / farnesylcysteine lyase